METREPWEQVRELSVNLCREARVGRNQPGQLQVVAYRISVWESLPCLSYRVVQCDQLLEDPGSKISICRVLASSLKTKGRRPLLTKKGNRMNVVISWEQLVEVVGVQRSAEVVAVRSDPGAGADGPMGYCHRVSVGVASLFVVVVVVTRLRVLTIEEVRCEGGVEEACGRWCEV